MTKTIKIPHAVKLGVIVSLFLFFHFTLLSQTITKTYSCTFSSSISPQWLKDNPPPKWDDSRLNTIDGMIAIVTEAADEIMTKLKSRCDVQLPQCNRCPVGNHPHPGEDLELSKGLWLIRGAEFIDDGCDYFGVNDPPFVEVDYKLNPYVQIQRQSDAGAQTMSSYTASSFPPSEYLLEFKCNSGEIREHFEFRMEVFPAVFQDGYLYIPNEERWARTAVEAMEYVLLHEFGHAEGFYVSHNVSYKSTLSSQGDTEEDAWNYASSVMMCEH